MLVLFYCISLQGEVGQGEGDIGSPMKCLTEWRTLVGARCRCRVSPGASRRQIQRVDVDCLGVASLSF